MAEIEEYSLESAQRLVRDAISRSENRFARWRALEKLYRTGQAVGTVTAGDVPDRLWDDIPELTLESINMVLPHANMIKATAMAHDPEFLVEPYSGGEQADVAAYQANEVLKYFWKRLSGTHIARDMTHDMVVLGNGFAKVGWAFAETYEEKTDTELADELKMLQETERRAAVLEDRSPKDNEQLVELLDFNKPVATRDEPFIEYVSPYDIFVPATARRIHEARWIAQRIIVPYDEVKANEAFNNDAVDQLQPASRTDRAKRRSDDERIEEGSGEDDPFAEVTLFEFYDMRARKMKVFGMDSEDPLYEGPLPYSHRHPPFVHMRNFEDGGIRFWAFGDIENIASIQSEFNEYVYEQMSNARRAGNKYAVDSEVLTDQMRELLESEQSDVVVPVDLQQKPINEAIQPMARQSLPTDIYQAKDELSMRMREVLGLNDFQTGGSGANRMSATAAAVVEGTASLRAADKKFQVETSLNQMGLLIILLCQEFMDIERSVRVMQPEGVAKWIQVDKDDLKGEYGIEVQGGSTQAVNPSTRQQRALEVMTQIIPMLGQEGYDTQPLWRDALRDYGYDPDRVLKKPPQQPPQPGQGGGPPGGGPGGGQGPPQGPPPGMGPGGGPGQGSGPQAPQPPPGSNSVPSQQMMGGPPVPSDTSGQDAL